MPPADRPSGVYKCIPAATPLFRNGHFQIRKFRQIAAQRVSDQQLTLLLKNHDTHTYQSFGLRSDPEHIFCLHRVPCFPIPAAESVVIALISFLYPDHSPCQPLLLDILIKKRSESLHALHGELCGTSVLAEACLAGNRKMQPNYQQKCKERDDKFLYRQEVVQALW